eukprot:498194-Rhodomonas_salina.1
MACKRAGVLEGCLKELGGGSQRSSQTSYSCYCGGTGNFAGKFALLLLLEQFTTPPIVGIS